MKRFQRHIIAGILIAIYIVIAIIPLAPLAMRSTTMAHPIRVECSGDCDICGCSHESRASRTCCCRQNWVKNRQHAGHEDSVSNNSEKKQHDTETTLSCNYPCGSGKLLALWGLEKFEALPYQFSWRITSPLESPLFLNFLPHLSTRCLDPPDPPPRILSIS